MRHFSFSIGDIIYYVEGEDAAYRIKKTRIVGSCKRSGSFRIGSAPVFEYLVYRTEDGRLVSETELHSRKDEMRPSTVFHSKDEAISYIIDCLLKQIDREKQIIINAQERLDRAERVLKVYRKYE